MGTNAPIKPQFEGDIVVYKSPHADVWIYDVCVRNPKYGWLEWHALNDPTQEEIDSAMHIPE